MLRTTGKYHLSAYREKSSAIGALAIASAFAVSLLGASPSAHATFILETQPSGLGQNVIVNACNTVIQGPAPTVQGCLNSNHAQNVDVSTTGGGQLTSSGGQAVFAASGGNIGNFSIAFANGDTFDGLVFNVDIQDRTDSTGTITVARVGEPDQVFSNVALSGNGNNFFTLRLDPNIPNNTELATSVTLTSSLTNIVDITQIRIAGPGIPNPVPEPASLALLGSALVGFGFLRRRKRV